MSRFSESTEREILALNAAGASPRAIAGEVLRMLGVEPRLHLAGGKASVAEPVSDEDYLLAEDTKSFLDMYDGAFKKHRAMMAQARRFSGKASGPKANLQQTEPSDARIALMRNVHTLGDYIRATGEGGDGDKAA